MTKTSTHLEPYANVLKGWQAAWGKPITAQNAELIHNLGNRPGKQALYLIMGLRNEGVSVEKQYRPAGALFDPLHPKCGTANNNANALVQAGYISIKRVSGTHTIQLTAKGKAVAEGRAKMAPKGDYSGSTKVEPAKPAPKAKADKPKPKADKPAKGKGNDAPKPVEPVIEAKPATVLVDDGVAVTVSQPNAA